MRLMDRWVFTRRCRWCGQYARTPYGHIHGGNNYTRNRRPVARNRS